MKNRNYWIRLLCFLRRNGLLCRKTEINPYIRKRVSHVVLPFDGYTYDYNRTAQHIFSEARKISGVQ